MESTIEGFKFSVWPGDKLFLQIESDRLQECIAFCNTKRIKFLHISPYHGFYLDNVNFLSECPYVEEIHMQRGFSDYDGLYEAPRLRALSVIFDHSINFSKIPCLVSLSTEWNRLIDKTLFSTEKLESLWLRGYKSEIGNLSSIARLKNLTYLHLVKSSIQSVRGIEVLTKLKRLGLSYCSKLEDIQPLMRLDRCLEELEVSHCKRIERLTSIGKLKRLKKIILFKTGNIPSLDFIRQIPKLEFLSFVGTDVLDGDMTPCFLLEYAGFLKKRHYSHTPKQVREIIAKATKNISDGSIPSK